MEVVLNRLLQRAKVIFSSEVNHDPQTPYLLLPFFKGDFNLDDYLQLDDGVLNTYFIHWKRYPDDILSNLASRFIDRKPLKSVKFDKSTSNLLPRLRQIIEQSGFNPDYYTATDNSFDLPYDAYQADKKQIHLMQDDGTLVSLSSVSPLVRAISDRQTGDNRFFFPREILKPDENVDLFQPEYDEFNRHIRNDQLIQ